MSGHPENGSHRPKGKLPEGQFETVLEHTDRLVGRAAQLGIQMSVAYQNGYSYQQEPKELDLYLLGDGGPVFAASHAKLAVAAFELERAPEDVEHVHKVARMLKRSDNNMFAKFKQDRAEEVNDYAASHAGVASDILTIRPDGTSYSGQTTALDSMQLFVHLLHTAKKHGHRDEISRALAKNTSNYGVRRALRPHDGVKLLNKTGDYYGRDDPEVHENVHHDVGVVFTGKNHSNQRLLYSITTTAPSVGRARIANQLNRQLGVDYVESVGGRPVRPLGHRVVSLLVQGPGRRR